MTTKLLLYLQWRCCDRNCTRLRFKGCTCDVNSAAWKKQMCSYLTRGEPSRVREVMHRGTKGASLCCASSSHRTKGPFTVRQLQWLWSHFGRSWQILHFQPFKESQCLLFDLCPSFTFISSLTQQRFVAKPSVRPSPSQREATFKPETKFLTLLVKNMAEDWKTLCQMSSFYLERSQCFKKIVLNFH